MSRFTRSAVAVAAVLTSSLLPAGQAVAAPAAQAAQAAPVASCAVIQSMQLADAHWIATGPDQAADNWQNATFNVGNLAFVRTSGVTNHYTLPWAQGNAFGLPASGGPDDFATGEAYLDLYDYYHPDPPSLAALRARIHDLVTGGKTKPWAQADAINMAMPSLARIGVKDADPAILATMRTLFRGAEKRFYNPSAGLWWRDRRYRHTSFYASQANGWVLAGLAKVVQALPADDPGRPGYIKIIKRMAPALRRLQRGDGFWNADLRHPWPAGGPETSGTALITYGLAWGVQSGVLDATTYLPVVTKAWQGLTTKALHTDGVLGYVQDRDAPPWNRAGANDTTAYGVGAFLSAGREVALLTPGCS